MIRISSRIICVCLAEFLAVCQLEAGQLRAVATTKTAVPGAASPFDGFGSLSLNNNGHVAFNARRRVNPSRFDSGGVWSEGNGNGLAIVDPPGFGHWDLVLNDLGVVSFTNGSLMQGSSLVDSRVVAAYGQSAPGIASVGATFSDFFYHTASVFNDRNEVAFTKAAGGFTRLYIGASQDSLRLVASAGQQISDGYRTGYVSNLGAAELNDAGDLLFYARVHDDPAYASQPRFVSYLWTRNQELKRIAGAGDSIETDRGVIEVSSVSSQLNHSGQIGLLINESVLAVSSPSGYKVVAREEYTIDGERTSYFTNRWAMAAGDAIVYEAAMIGGDGGPYQSRILLRNAPGEPPEVIAKGMTQAPGAPAGHIFSPYFGNFAVNRHGQVAFTSNLWDVTTGASIGRGIWLENEHGILEPVVQIGDFVDLDDGPGTDLRQILNIGEISMGGNLSGSASLFNDRGQVAFVATFTDFTQAILVSAATVPEPAGAGFALSIFAAVVALRQRRLDSKVGGVRLWRFCPRL